MATRLKIGFRKRMMNDHEIENRVQNEVSDGHKSWNNRIWYRNWIENKMTDCHKIRAKVGTREVVTACHTKRNRSWDTKWYNNWI